YSQLLESTDRRVREDSFKGFFKVYQQFKNTFASTLSAHVKMHNFQAKARNYQSAREASLNANHLPEIVHDNLLNVVGENLPLLHRYMALRKEVLNVETLHMYD